MSRHKNGGGYKNQANQKGNMLFEEPWMRKMLRRVVYRVKVDSISTDDLIQEGLIHLWRLERRSPGQTLSWYLQSCRFHLLHYVNAGRSVDVWKRRRLVVSFSSQSKPNGWLT